MTEKQGGSCAVLCPFSVRLVTSPQLLSVKRCAPAACGTRHRGTGTDRPRAWPTPRARWPAAAKPPKWSAGLGAADALGVSRFEAASWMTCHPCLPPPRHWWGRPSTRVGNHRPLLRIERAVQQTVTAHTHTHTHTHTPTGPAALCAAPSPALAPFQLFPPQSRPIA